VGRVISSNVPQVPGHVTGTSGAIVWPGNYTLTPCDVVYQQPQAAVTDPDWVIERYGLEDVPTLADAGRDYSKRNCLLHQRPCSVRMVEVYSLYWSSREIQAPVKSDSPSCRGVRLGLSDWGCQQCVYVDGVPVQALSGWWVGFHRGVILQVLDRTHQTFVSFWDVSDTQSPILRQDR